ncbi:expressed unknown protein [Seminavis robusta]|uniref:Uncharacterized protein n=1 Tax=Seminavis robusta TaxID=568900 RepID=A0A9N8HLU6_9STRA|nr:expressed unknown protein [Seminavis robusta]|eukprot:Sro1059_g236590.1 n/a (181) ;mRNA; r:37214-37756
MSSNNGGSNGSKKLAAIDEHDTAGRNSMDSVGEKDSLLKSSSRVSDIASSTRSTASSTGRNSYWTFSSHWLDTAAVKRDRFQSERERAVDRGIAKAAFLIRDAVMGESENPSQGTYDPYQNPENKIRNLLSLVFRQILSYRLLRQLLYGCAWGLSIVGVRRKGLRAKIVGGHACAEVQNG